MRNMHQTRLTATAPPSAAFEACGPELPVVPKPVTWLEASTRVATAMGEVQADALWPQDKLLTPRGAVPLQACDVWQGVGTGASAPVVFSPGVLGNALPLRLGQSQPLLVRLPDGVTHRGHSEVLLPARALVNGQEICLRPCKHICYIRLILPQAGLIFAEGALCDAEGAARADRPQGALRLGYGEAMMLLARLRGEKAGLPLLY